MLQGDGITLHFSMLAALKCTDIFDNLRSNLLVEKRRHSLFCAMGAIAYLSIDKIMAHLLQLRSKKGRIIVFTSIWLLTEPEKYPCSTQQVAGEHNHKVGSAFMRLGALLDVCLSWRP